MKGMIFGLQDWKQYLVYLAEQGEIERTLVLFALKKYFEEEKLDIYMLLQRILRRNISDLNLNEQSINIYLRSEARGLLDNNLPVRRMEILLKELLKKVEQHQIFAKYLADEMEKREYNFLDTFQSFCPPQIFEQVISNFAVQAINKEQKPQKAEFYLGKHLAILSANSFLQNLIDSKNTPKDIKGSDNQKRGDALKSLVAKLLTEQLLEAVKIFVEALGKDFILKRLRTQNFPLSYENLMDLNGPTENAKKFLLKTLDYLSSDEQEHDKVINNILLQRLERGMKKYMEAPINYSHVSNLKL